MKSHHCYLVSLLLACCCIGCTAPQEASNAWEFPHAEAPLRDAAYILTTCDPQVGFNKTNLLWIKDTNFVGNLYSTLMNAAPRPVTLFTLMPPRPIVFTDASEKVLAAYYYEPLSIPPDVFQPCRIRIADGVYELRRHFSTPEELRQGLVVPGFRSLAESHFQVYPKLESITNSATGLGKGKERTQERKPGDYR
jgi:hypothetical protein